MGRQLLIVLVFGLGLGSVQATNVRRPLSEVESLLHQADQAHQVAQSHREWMESPYSPESLAREFKQRSHSLGFIKALCQALQNSPAEDLYYVSDFFLVAPKSVCLTEQKKRYQKYLLEQHNKIQGRLGASIQSSQKLGPSIEVPLRFEDAPLIIDGTLPPKTLALTFDDGPHPSRTQALLEILEQQNAQIHFFLVGKNTRSYPDLVRQEIGLGHEVGCHSDTHADLRKISKEAAIAEIENGFNAITNSLGRPAVFFRFPYGAFTPALRQHLVSTRTPEFFWNIDTWDWKHKDPAQLFEFALEEVRRENHGVVLFHDIQPQTIAMMPSFLEALKQEGYRLAVFRPTHTRISPRAQQ